MELECTTLARTILPGVRASVAQGIERNYHYSQQTIAGMIGVDQVAISKYLNGKYSKGVAQMKKYVESKGLDRNILKYAANPSTGRVMSEIDNLCIQIIAKNK